MFVPTIPEPPLKPAPFQLLPTTPLPRPRPQADQGELARLRADIAIRFASLLNRLFATAEAR